MYCTILKKTYIFVLSIGKVINTPQNKRFAARNYEKAIITSYNYISQFKFNGNGFSTKHL
jgi:hypothetical protein